MDPDTLGLRSPLVQPRAEPTLVGLGRARGVVPLLIAAVLAGGAPVLAQPAPPEAGSASPPPPAAPSPAPGGAGAGAGELDDPPPVSAEDKAAARRHFERGLQLLGEEAWEPALAEFLRSRELFATRVATNNAAVALRKLQRYDEALDLYEALLRDFQVPDEERAKVQREISELRELVGTLDIVGAEPGSAIVIDSIDRGQYPPVKPLRVPAGTHTVRLFKEGFEAYETRLNVVGGGMGTVRASMPKLSSSGRLRITEQGGRSLLVVVDNVVVGKTPWQGTLAVGEHVVVLRGTGKLGSPPARASVKAGEVTALTLRAEELDAQLRVEPRPAGATVFIDGVNVGNGAWLGRLKSGTHRVEVRADGFLAETRDVKLARGQRQTLALELDRDDDAPVWRKPSKWTVDGSGALLVAPSFSGDLAESCAGGCSASTGLGGLVLVNGGYELGTGLGFGLELGWLGASQDVEGREAALVPVGLDPLEGSATDELSLSGALVGASLGYHTGEQVPIVLRLGVGALIGSLRDERTGVFTSRAGDPFTTYPVGDVRAASYLYASPLLRVGYRLVDKLEVGLSVRALVLFALAQPRWDETQELGAGTDGVGTYPRESLTGSTVVMLAPGLDVRREF